MKTISPTIHHLVVYFRFIDLCLRKVRTSLLYALLTFIFFILGSFSLKSQNPLWLNGDKLLSFSATGGTQSTVLPQPAGVLTSLRYNGQVAQNNQYVQYDANGALLFFIIDGSIYDRNGCLIASSVLMNSYANDPYSIGQLVVTMVPGSCQLYYIIYPDGFVVLDIAAQNPLFPNDPTKKGTLIHMLNNETLACVDEPMIGAFESFFQQVFPAGYGLCGFSGCYTNSGCHPTTSGKYFALLPFAESPGDPHPDYKYVEVIDNGVGTSKRLYRAASDRIDVFDIRSNGIFYQSNFLGAVCQAGVFSNNSLEAGSYNGAQYLALSLSCSGAESESSAGLILYTLDSSGNIIGFNNINNHVAGYNGFTGALEFSSNGRYLYYTMANVPYIGYLDLSDMSTHDLTDLVSIANEQQFIRGQIEKQVFQGVQSILFPSSSGFAALIDADNPSNATFIANAIPQAVMSNATYNAGVLGNCFINTKQNYLESQLITAQGEQCCLVEAILDGVQGMVINSSLDGTWTSGQNPFGTSGTSVRMMDDLVFLAGTNTVIDNMVFEFAPNADVIIQRGATVTLRNGSLWTSLKCENKMWPGVNLLGHTNSNWSISQMTGASGQGLFVIINSTIENALTAVEVGTNNMNTGGVIQALSSNFLNNGVDVYFREFHFRNSQGNYLAQKSKFEKCLFQTNQVLLNSNVLPTIHLRLAGVDKLKINECSFMNTVGGGYNWSQRGTGIFSQRASFIVDGNNDPWSGSPADLVNTTFYKLNTGIHSIGANHPLAFYVCKEQEFQFCLYSIINKNTDNIYVYNNHFLIPEPAGYSPSQPYSTARGVYLTNSTGYHVEQNFFEGFDDWLVSTAYPNAVGVWVDNSGDSQNEIRNNDFDAMRWGIYITRNNRDFISGINSIDEDTDDETGLQLFCNTFSNGVTDIYRDAQSTTRWDMGGPQPNLYGNAMFMATGNWFSSDYCGNPSYDFLIDPNNSVPTTYYCTIEPKAVPDCSSITNVSGLGQMQLLSPVVSTLGSTTIGSLDCPNYYPLLVTSGVIPGMAVLYSDLNNFHASLATARGVYEEVIDLNMTHMTMEELENSFPQESIYYYELLSTRSPLSNEVIQKLIDRSQLLNPWHLTQILLLNSPLDKELFELIRNSEILSGLYLSILQQAQIGVSVKQAMEMEIRAIAEARDKAYQELANACFHHQGYEMDSLEDETLYLPVYLNALSTIVSPNVFKQRASYWVSTDSLTQANEMMASTLLEQWYEVIEFQMIHGFGLDSLTEGDYLHTLREIYQADDAFASPMALSLLNLTGEGLMEPEPHLPIQHRSLFIPEAQVSEGMSLLGVWPNPSETETYIHYPIDADGIGIIKVYNSVGQMVHRVTLSSKGLYCLNVSDYAPGIYIVELLVGEKRIETIKLEVVSGKR